MSPTFFSLFIFLALNQCTFGIFDCSSIKNCSCFPQTQELECSSKLGSYSISYANNSEVLELQITCVSDHTNLILEALPRLNFPEIEKLSILGCSLKHQNVNQLMVRFGLDSLKTIAIKYMQTPVLALDKLYLPKITKITSIQIEDNKILKIEEDIFKNHNDLDEISFARNNIEHMSNIFMYTQNLQVLDLSGNALENLEEEIFAYTPHMTDLFLKDNILKKLPVQVFSNLRQLRTLDLSNNLLRLFPSNIFQFNEKLEFLDLSYNYYLILPQDIFRATRNLKVLRLEYCRLTTLSKNLFLNSTDLRELYLSNNLLQSLPHDLFKNLIELKILDLSHNKLHVWQHSSRRLINLEMLYLDNNELQKLDENVFHNLKGLKILDLSNNKIDEINMNTFDNCKNIEEIFLSHNQIRNLPKGPSKLSLLDASYNIITHLKLKFPPSTNIILINNSITECECGVYDHLNNIRFGNDFACTNSRNKSVVLNSETFVCTPTQSYICPKNCSCFKIPFYNKNVIDCSYGHLAQFPNLSAIESSGHLENLMVNLEGNDFITAPGKGMGYDNISELILSKNKLKHIHWIPDNIKVLYLDNNFLNSLDSSIWSKLMADGLEAISLHNNPWNCTCAQLGLIRFIKKSTILVNKSLICNGSKILLINLDEHILCKTFLIEIVISIIALILLITLIVIIIIYLKKNENGSYKVEKYYDIFLSYSYKDHNFVSRKLLAFLEETCRFKVCVHFRDWIIGDYIPKQISESITYSHVTIIVLSKHFLNSIWALYELRMVHSLCKKVIVLNMGDIDIQSMPELKHMLKKMKIYEYVDEYSFWDNLRKHLQRECKILTSLRNREIAS